MNKHFTNLNDEYIWELFLSGDGQALDHIVRKHFALLYNYGRKFTHDKDLVKDCVQDLFLSLWKNREHIGKAASVKHYLMKALRRKLHRALTGTPGKPTDSIEFLDLSALNTQSPEARKILEEQHSELSLKVITAISTLSKRQQEIIYLRFYIEADAGEIAAIMSLSRQSVYNLLQLALTRLRHLSNTLFQPGMGYIPLIITSLYSL